MCNAAPIDPALLAGIERVRDLIEAYGAEEVARSREDAATLMRSAELAARAAADEHRIAALAIRAAAALHGVVEKQCREAIRALNPELTDAEFARIFLKGEEEGG